MKRTFFLLCIGLLGSLLAGCAGTRMGDRRTLDFEPAIAHFYIEASSRAAQQATIPVILPVSEVQVNLDPRPILLEWDFRDVQIIPTRDGPAFNFVLTQSAARDFGRVSSNNVGKRLVLVVDQQVVGVTPINRPMTGGVIQLYLEIDDDDAPDLARRLARTSQEIQREIASR